VAQSPKNKGKKSAAVPWWVFDSMADATPNRVHWVTGGVGSGKTYGSAIWDITRCFQNGERRYSVPGTTSWTVAPNYRIVENLLKETIKVLVDCFNLRAGYHFALFRSFPRCLDFKPLGINHRVYFLSADNPEHFVSESITHWRWSEVGTSKPEVFDRLMDRLRDKRSNVLQGLGEGVPEGMNHFSELANFFGTDAKRNFSRYIVETGSNIHNLAPNYLDSLRSRYAYDSNRLLSYEKGLFTNFTKGSAYYEFHVSKHVFDPLEIDPALTILFDWDFNKSPLAWVVSQKVPTRNRESFRYIFKEESSGESRGLLDAVAEFAIKCPAERYAYTAIEIDGDASGFANHHNTPGCDYDQIVHYLHALGYQNVQVVAQRSNPLVRHRLEKTAALMAYGYVLVCNNCPNLIESFTRTGLKPGTWEIEKPSDDTWTHYGDAASYQLYSNTKDIDITRPSANKVLGSWY
jgi:hypothetical protein